MNGKKCRPKSNGSLRAVCSEFSCFFVFVFLHKTVPYLYYSFTSQMSDVLRVHTWELTSFNRGGFRGGVRSNRHFSSKFYFHRKFWINLINLEYSIFPKYSHLSPYTSLQKVHQSTQWDHVDVPENKSL